MNNNNAVTTPRSIIENNKIYNKPKDICNIANNYYINTIKKIREDIPKIPVKPIEVLKNMYPRNKNTFSIPIPTVEDIWNIIIKAPNSHSTGHDNISMNMIKND